jgi:hypothetical protein
MPMLKDPEEIAIISTAKQANVRNPDRPRVPFENIFKDFLGNVAFTGTSVIDMGPGHWDFGVIAAQHGAQVYGIDHDPAVIALGKHKGFHTIEGELTKPGSLDLKGRFDGLFCKFSINAFWFKNSVEAQREYISDLLAWGKPTAWIWIAPWNGAPANVPDPSMEPLEWQIKVFEEHGCKTTIMDPPTAKRYGVTGKVANHALFTRGL